ncbi:MAG: hypothetical protein JO117_08715, partial [Verrucomicrobia bacterium]|nr:hypothetical protein [Verrucomicrobiota bacterium]
MSLRAPATDDDPPLPPTKTDAPPASAAPTVVPAEPAAGPAALTWLRTGAEGIAAVLRNLATARESVRLEIYTFAPDGVGQRIRDALLAACERKVRVQVIVDALGSYDLPDAFFAPVRAVGGEMRWFNPPKRFNFGARDHRKLFVFDETRAIVGGFNLAD